MTQGFLLGLAFGLLLGIPMGAIVWTALGPFDRWLDVRRRS